MDRALEADGAAWPGGLAVVNGMSRDRDMRWSLEEGHRRLRWEQVDGLYDASWRFPLPPALVRVAPRVRRDDTRLVTFP